MKKLYLLRHAKSSWEDIALDDFDRQLNKRGLKDAPFMGNLLNSKDITADIIISSPSVRTKQTLNLINQQLKFPLEVIFNLNIYEATMDELEDVIKNIDNQYESVFLFGHNPSLNMFVEKYIHLNENIPTCGIVGIEFDSDIWEKINPKRANKIFFEYPKLYK